MNFLYTTIKYGSKKKQRALSWLTGIDPAIKRKVIMRIQLTAFLILFTLLHVCASGSAQQLTMTYNNASLKTVLAEINKQSGYELWYNNRHLEHSKVVSIKVKDAPLKDVLDKCFENQPLTYEITNKTIVIRQKTISLKDKLISLLQALKITGTIRDELGQPMPGVNILIKGTRKGTTTNTDGTYSIEAEENDILVFSFLGYQPQEITASNQSQINITLKENSTSLEAAQIVSTGYQSLPKERATGSFEIVDNKLLNRRISTNIIDRIENVVPGILFDRANRAPDKLSIRGRSTILAESAPLIVVDNFPFEGNFDDINPNDVESVTLLKDAAAASIWGARAGNGVIVITTKKGSTSKPKINLVSNLSFVSRTDLSSLNTITSADYIELEKLLFSKGYYSGDEASIANTPLTPVVELLIAKREGKIDPTIADRQIEAFKNYDSNTEIERNLYRSAINQQYQMNISGQTPNLNYYFSAGMDESPGTLVGNKGDNRISIRSSNNFLITPKFSFEAGLNYVQSLTNRGNNPGYLLSSGGNKSLYPYARLADEAGNPLNIVQNYRTSFVDAAMQKGLLDWTYSPLGDMSSRQAENASKNLLSKTALRYKIVQGMNAEVIYQYQSISGRNETNNNIDSYFTRNQINRFTQVATGTNVITRPIPLGDIRRLDHSLSISHQGRGQLNYQKDFGKHRVSTLVGIEIRELKSTTEGDLYYGYNSISNSTATSLDYTRQFPQYNNPSTSAPIPTNQYISNGTVDHFWSYFSNASYTYDDKYILSGSARTDASNLFGVKTNQKGVPLWSAGVAWQVHKESFYAFDWIPQLKLRATYGVQGNFSRATAAVTTARYSSTSTGLTYATILNPPNESLRWERVKMLNVGLDFTLKRNILDGSIEYYNKRASDLMGTAPIDPTTGLALGQSGGQTTFLGNIANIAGHGVDIRLTSQNINRQLLWSTTAMFSAVKMVVSKYFMPISALGISYIGGTFNPIEGRPLFGLLSYKWAGLDPSSGDPQGYLNGTVSKDYSNISATTPLSDMVYSGNITPNYFGALRNDLSYKRFSLSINVSFKAGYYFRRNSINYTNVFNRWNDIGSSDYQGRWLETGDEQTTNVPSMIFPGNSNRDSFYASSEILVEKADHIRFEDFSFGYDLSKQIIPRLPVDSARLFIYANNLGIIWKDNKLGIDPDFVGIPQNRRTISIGLNVMF